MGLIDYIKDLASSNIRRALKDVEEDLSRAVYFGARKISRYIMKEIYAMLFITMALVFVAIAATFFLIEYLNLSKAISFLIVGGIILLIGLILKVMN